MVQSISHISRKEVKYAHHLLPESSTLLKNQFGFLLKELGKSQHLMKISGLSLNNSLFQMLGYIIFRSYTATITNKLHLFYTYFSKLWTQMLSNSKEVQTLYMVLLRIEIFLLFSSIDFQIIKLEIKSCSVSYFSISKIYL